MRKPVFGFSLATTLATLAVAFAPVPAASAATIGVNCNKQKLQHRIAAAPPGSTLLIEGTCVGTFTVAKNLTLKGNPHATLDGNGKGSTLSIKGAPIVHLKRLTITGGSAEAGGGISHAAGPLSLEQVTVKGNAACCAASVDGGGIYSAAGRLTILRSSILGNHAEPTLDNNVRMDARGGGVFCDGPLRIEDSKFSSNVARAGGGDNGGDSGGGAIYSAGGSITILRSSFLRNRAVSITGGFASAGAQGGGIFTHGPLSIGNSRVGRNVAKAGAGGGANAYGGGVFAESSLRILSSRIDGNRAILAPTYASGSAAGGGVLDAAPNKALTITASSFEGNIAKASATFGPVATGGGLNADSKSLIVTSVTFSGNVVHATSLSSDGTPLAQGGSVNVTAVDQASMTNVRVLDSEAIADGGPPTAAGGGIEASGQLSLVSSTIARNAVSASNESQFGPSVGGGGGLNHPAGLTSVVRTTIAANRVVSSAGDDNATGYGGGVYAGDRLVAKASTFNGNSVSSTAPGHQAEATGAGLSLAGSTGRVVNSSVAGNSLNSAASGGSAIAEGGGVYGNGGATRLLESTVARNRASAAGTTSTSRGGGLYRENGTLTLEATIAGLNNASSGRDCYGTIFSEGHNVIGHTAVCAFNAKPSDVLNKDPKLGPLSDNGGPTRTMALLTGSPALNKIPPAACPLPRDQRGVSRPQGPGCDIGGYERKS